MFKLLKKKQKENKSMFDEIVSWNNICMAYLDIYQSFTEKCKGHRYHAADGQTIYDIEVDNEEILKEIQQEMMSLSPLHPARYYEIAKPGGGIRNIYSLSVKERIKCQAIYRVLEPYFEERYSDHIYSFRSSKPSYYASRAVRRFYLRNYGKKMYVLRLDIHKYADFLNHDYLRGVMRNLGVEEKVIKMVDLFLNQPYIKKENYVSRSTGAMQGMTLCSLFYNIYIGHVDDYVGENVHFYRRVGDDLILFDRSKEKLLRIKKYLECEAEKGKLFFSKEKEDFGNINKIEFSFHGLVYKDGVVSLRNSSFNKIMRAWKKRLKYNENLPHRLRLKRLKDFIQTNNRYVENGNNVSFMDFIRAYNLITNTQQIQEISKKFFYILSKYFTGGTTYRNMNRTKKMLKQYNFPTFSRLHKMYTSGKIRGKNFKWKFEKK